MHTWSPLGVSEWLSIGPGPHPDDLALNASAQPVAGCSVNVRQCLKKTVRLIVTDGREMSAACDAVVLGRLPEFSLGGIIVTLSSCGPLNGTWWAS